MFFSKTIKEWQENRAIKKKMELLEKKEKACNESKGDVLLFFGVGLLSTVVLSGIFTVMVFVNMSIFKYGGDIVSTVNIVLVLGNVFIYLWLIYGIILSLNYALHNAKIYFS